MFAEQFASIDRDQQREIQALIDDRKAASKSGSDLNDSRETISSLERRVKLEQDLRRDAETSNAGRTPEIGEGADVERRIQEAVRAGDVGRFPAQRIGNQKEALRKLAEKNPDVVFARPAGSDAPESGEHDIVYRDERVWKYTKDDQFGLTPVADTPDIQNLDDFKLGISPSTPDQYLERNRIHNRIFDDDIRVEGLTADGGLVISQPRITGRAATRGEIEEGFAELGFVPVPDGEALLSGLLEGTAFAARKSLCR